MEDLTQEDLLFIAYYEEILSNMYDNVSSDFMWD